MSDNFVTVASHRRAMPKRKFADSEASASQPDEPVRMARGGSNDDDLNDLPARDRSPEEDSALRKAA
jgi:hypothetical protein